MTETKPIRDRLPDILAAHAAWLRVEPEGVRADLSRANLRWADLSRANLRWANLCRANLRWANLCRANLSSANLSSADLSRANLRWANLCRANLSSANLSGADLSSADLSGADLSSANLCRANLSSANLSGADLSSANLREANLSGANLREANLSSADLREANLSGTSGVLDAAGWLAEHLERDAEGVIAYKALPSPQRSMPEHWRVEPGAVLTEVVNPDRGTDCGSGVNVGTLEWVRKNYPGSPVWRCRIAWIDLAGVVVPFGTDGKFRAGRVTLIEEVAK